MLSKELACLAAFPLPATRSRAHTLPARMSEQPPVRSNLALRLLTAAVTVPLILYSLSVGPHWLFPLLVAISTGFGSLELFKMVMPAHRLAQVWGVLASLTVFAVVGFNLSSTWLNAALITLICGGMLVSLIAVEPVEHAASRTGWSIAGPMYIGGLFGILVQLFQEANGGAWVLLALLAAFWSDTGGYFAGRKYGKRTLYKRVSPNKTIEGSIGGLLGALVGGLLVHFFLLQSVPLLNIVLLTLAAAAAGQAGDLCESLIKRSTGVKDSGTILPGHGGILDRVDALLFSASMVWIYVQLFSP